MSELGSSSGQRTLLTTPEEFVPSDSWFDPLLNTHSELNSSILAIKRGQISVYNVCPSRNIDQILSREHIVGLVRTWEAQ